MSLPELQGGRQWLEPGEDRVAVSEQEVADLLAGMTRVQLAIIRGLSQNHPRTADNVIQALREEARLAAETNGATSLTGLPARYLLSLLEAKPPNGQGSTVQADRGHVHSSRAQCTVCGAEENSRSVC